MFLTLLTVLSEIALLFLFLWMAKTAYPDRYAQTFLANPTKRRELISCLILGIVYWNITGYLDDEQERDEALWNLTKKANFRKAYCAYLGEFPTGAYAAQANLQCHPVVESISEAVEVKTIPHLPNDPHCQGNCVEGYGSYTFVNKDSYKGQWKAGQMNGQGSYTFANGDNYEGDFSENKKAGFGVFTLGNGSEYRGQFVADAYDGQGTYTSVNGDKYVGHFKKGKKDGQGDYIFANGEKYVGEFKQDKKDGQGSYFFINGNRYIGAFKNDKREGQGTYTTAAGLETTGDWKNNQLVP